MQKLSEVTKQLIADICDLAADIDTETAAQPKGYAEIAAAQQRRNALQQRFDKMRDDSRMLNAALERLRLPSPEMMVWAKSLLDLPNTAILEIDTTSIDYNADVIRVLLLSTSGDVLFDCIMRGPTGESNQEHTGIAPETLAHAQPVEQSWPEVIAELSKYYLVSYGMDFDSDHISVQNQRLNAPPYRLFTEDLQQKLAGYFRKGYYTKLEDVAAEIGHTMPEKPQRDALDRARATLALLKAVAEGFIKTPLAESGGDFPF